MNEFPLFYKLYGYVVNSTIPLGSAIEFEGAPDIFVRQGHLPVTSNFSECFQELHWNFNSCLWNTDCPPRFFVENSDKIIIEDCTLFENLHPAVLDMSFAAASIQRGDLTIHASSIRINEQGILLMGPSGLGKSTTATLLTQQKEGILLSDDFCRLRYSNGGWEIATGRNEVSLSEASVHITRSENLVIEGCRRFDSKMRVSFNQTCDFDFTPLKAIFHLTDGSSKVLDHIGAFVCLMNSVLLGRYYDFLHPGLRAQAVSNIISQVPIYEVESKSVSTLSKMISFLENC